LRCDYLRNFAIFGLDEVATVDVVIVNDLILVAAEVDLAVSDFCSPVSKRT
jgi:hypothetical protein